jgi:hypothetical protein
MDDRVGSTWLRWIGRALFLAFLLSVVAADGTLSPITQGLAFVAAGIAVAAGNFRVPDDLC